MNVGKEGGGLGGVVGNQTSLLIASFLHTTINPKQYMFTN